MISRVHLTVPRTRGGSLTTCLFTNWLFNQRGLAIVCSHVYEKGNFGAGKPCSTRWRKRENRPRSAIIGWSMWLSADLIALKAPPGAASLSRLVASPTQLLIFHYVSSCHALVRNHIADNLARCDWPAKCRESPRTTAAKKSPHCSQGIKCQRVTPKKHQLLNQLQWLVLLLPVSAPLSLPALVASSPLSSATVLRLPLRTLPLLLLTPVPVVRETRTLAPVVPVLFVTAPERVRLTSLTLNEHVSGYITGFN